MTASIYACGFSFLFHIKDLMALNGFLKNYQSWVETEAKSLLFISFACLCCNLKLWKNDFYPSMSTILPNHGTCFKCNALKCLIFKSHSGLWERTRYMAVLFWGSVLAGKSWNTHTMWRRSVFNHVALPGDPASLHEAGWISSSFADRWVAAWTAASSAVGVRAVGTLPVPVWHTNQSHHRPMGAYYKSTIHQTAAHLEAFCLLCGDLALLGPLSLEAEGEDERPLLQELLRCRRFALLPTLLADVCPGDADVLRWRAWPRLDWWCLLEEWPPFPLGEWEV